jgi:hypothetical protein
MTDDNRPDRDDAALRELVWGCPWLLDILRTVERAGLPDAWVGAGIVRDLVWDSLYGAGFDPATVKDVDVAFYDSADTSAARDAAAEAALRQLTPDVPWDAKNQAAVHLWYASRFGDEVAALISTRDGVDTWPETATAVALRVTNDVLDVYATFGLSDLLGGVWRRNPRRVSPTEYLARIERKCPHERWPGVSVLGSQE